MRKVSFVIPVYQRRNLLQNTLEALNYQNGHIRKDYEVIVVDDGSDGDMLRTVREICRNYKLKYIFLERDGGSCCARARNFGWRAAEGDVISFLDADMIVNQNYLNEVQRCFAAKEDILLIGLRLLLKENISLTEVRSRKVIKKFDTYCSSPEYMENRHPVFCRHSYNMSAFEYPWFKAYGCNMSIPKRWLEKVGGFDENYKNWGVEDLDLAYRLYAKGLKIILSSKLVALHQFHGSSDTVDNIKLEGYLKNVGYFLDKHPNALHMPKGLATDGFTGLLDIEMLKHQKVPARIEAIDIRRKKDLDHIKETVKRLTAENNIEIIINDYIKDGDMDLWIQLLGPRNSTPKYYPAKCFRSCSHDRA